MALQTSGAISIGDIATEFGGSAPHSLSEYYGAAAGVPTSGQIGIANFYGKSSQFTFTITSNQTNANLATLATAAGWDGSSNLQATINSGVYISSNSTGTPALTVSGSYPAGVTLINNGYIVGKGGNGGYGYSGTSYPNYGSSGYSGGGALSVSSAISITNNGTIAGGGGGGGGGGTKWRSAKPDGYGSGGGGGGGRSSAASNSSGGPRGYQRTTGIVVSWGSAGSSGTVSSAGGGGSGTHARYGVFDPSSEEYAYYNSYGGAGGTGGGWGSNGSSGSAGSGTSVNRSSGPGGGGSAGYAVSGNSNITWNSTGTRLGSVS